MADAAAEQRSTTAPGAGVSPAISVLMPCHNAAETLDEAIQSMLSQSLSDFELIAVDDGSVDGTRERLQAWAETDSRIRLIVRSQAGIITSLNEAWVVASAPLLARMDADDRADPHRLEDQAAYLADHPEIAVVGSLVEGFPKGSVRKGFEIYLQWLNGLVAPEDIAREIFIESPLVHPSVMIRNAWLQRVAGYQDFGWPEDYDLWLRLHLAGAKFAKVPKTLLYWREHPRRATRSDSRYSVENFIRAKACYLMQGPLREKDAVFIWGAGQMGRRVSKHLLKRGAPIVAFLDVDPKKIGGTKRGRPVIAPAELMHWWRQFSRPSLLAAVRSRGARGEIRSHLQGLGLVEAEDWWAVA